MTKQAVAYLGLGSNLGDRLSALRAAVRMLDDHPDIEVDFQSGVASIYETKPVGGPPGQPNYLNSAVRVRTSLQPHDLLRVLLDVEARLGRVRREKSAPRTIDLDLLLYDDIILNDDSLTIPHPRLHERRFVLEPLSEIAGQIVHPLLGKTIESLWHGLRSFYGTESLESSHSRDWFEKTDALGATGGLSASVGHPKPLETATRNRNLL